MTYDKALSTLGAVTANTRAKAIAVLDHCQATLGRTPGVLWGMGSGSEHGTGRAIDFMTSQNGRGLDDELGNCIADYLLAHGAAFGLAWIIWRQRIYPGSGAFVASMGYPANPAGGWRTMEDRGSTTQNHMDHVHALFGVDTAIAGGSTSPASSGAPALPAWSLPAGHFYGLISGPEQSHGGYYQAERPVIRAIQQRLIAKGYVPGITRVSDGWADGLFEQPTATAVAAFQHAEMPGTQYWGQVWSDDYAQLAK